MKRLICLVFLVLVLFPAFTAEQPQPPEWKLTLSELKQRLESLEQQIKLISGEWWKTENALMSLKIEQGKMKSYYENMAKRLQDRIVYLKSWGDRLEEAKKQLQERIAKYEDYENLQKDLNTSWKAYKQETQWAINIRDGICSLSIAVAVGVTTYELSKDPLLSAGSGIGSGLLTYFLLKIF